jgi:hypothetical protein
MIVAYSASGWTELIVSLSIFVPVAIAAAITFVVLRGSKNDPDEQRWQHQADERKRLQQEADARGD